MQNIQTAQQAQNPEFITVSRELAETTANALFDFEQLADAAETIALTIKELTGDSHILIKSQAKLLSSMIEKTRLDYDGKELCCDLYDFLEMAESR